MSQKSLTKTDVYVRPSGGYHVAKLKYVLRRLAARSICVNAEHESSNTDFHP